MSGNMSQIETVGHTLHIRVNGHDFIDMGRCWNCSMKYRDYLEVESASKKQPEREDLKDWLKCPQVKEAKQ